MAETEELGFSNARTTIRFGRCLRQGESREMRRAALFVDYWNAVRHGADMLEKGHKDHAEGTGHFSPYEMGELLCRKFNAKQSAPLSLEVVHVYWGVPEGPSSEYDSAQRRMKAWEESGAITHPRPHQNRKEVGVDVLMSIDIVEGALDDDFDVAIVCSADRDFAPPFRYVRQLPSCDAHRVSWGVSKESGRYLRLDGERQPFTHFLEVDDLLQIADTTDYEERTSQQGGHRQ